MRVKMDNTKFTWTQSDALYYCISSLLLSLLSLALSLPRCHTHALQMKCKELAGYE